MRRTTSSIAALAAITLAVGSTSADLIAPHSPPPTNYGPTIITVNQQTQEMDPGTPYWNADPVDKTNPELNYWIVPTTQSTYTVGGAVITNVVQKFDSDPVMGYSIDIDNTTASPMTINLSKTVTVALSQIAPVPGPTIYKGTLGISLTDNNLDGASVTDNSGASVYQASIDGSPVLELFNLTSLPGPFNVPQSFSYSVAPSDTGTDSASGGYFYPGPAVTSSMSIRLTFVLSPFDSASITSNFVVQPVPEPASLGLLGLGAFALLRRRR
jgi:hypothetical protein